MSSEPETKKVKRTRVVTHILAHDWETTGMNLLTHWAPEFGAALWKIGERQPEATFYRCPTLPDWVKAYAHNHDPLSDANSIGALASYFLSKCE